MRRIVTAILLIPAFIWLVLWGPPYLIAAVVLLIIETGLWEFFRLAESSGTHPVRIPGYALAAAIGLSFIPRASTAWLLSFVFILPLVLLVWAMLSGFELKGFLASTASTLLGILYVAVPLGLLLSVCLRSGGRRATLFALAAVWVGDSAAFFVGSAWGRHKLWPRVSPGKTWEGAAASLIAAVLVGLILAVYFWHGLSYSEAALLAAGINVAAQIGDLAESALKRGAGVKDSSNLVPGHGGVLDRIDALLFAAPVLWYYWFLRAL